MASSGIRSRLAQAQWALKPQDLAMGFKLAVLGPQRLSFAALADQMCLSVFEAHACVSRLLASKLLTDIDGQLRLQMAAFEPLVLLAAAHVFPPVRGEVTMGFVTAHGAAPLRSKLLLADDLPPVWPPPDGDTRGVSLLALYPKLPAAALKDARLYECLALFDSLRIGQARERELAKTLLQERLRAPHPTSEQA